MQPGSSKETHSQISKNTEEVNYLLGKFLQRLKVEGPGVWPELAADVLKTLNIQPDYVKGKTASFLEMREHLDTEPGILISNHPSVIDLFLVLLEIKRKDLLIMMQRKRFTFFEAVMGKDNILQAPQGGKEMADTIQRVKHHIDSGGLFIIFPSGGAETATGELSFKSGFRVLLNELNSDVMVYSFYIDPTAASKIQKELVGPPINAQDKPLLLAPELHIRSSPEPLMVKIDESYSRAATWKETAAKSNMLSKEEQNDALLQIFTNQFSH